MEANLIVKWKFFLVTNFDYLNEKGKACEGGIPFLAASSSSSLSVRFFGLRRLPGVRPMSFSLFVFRYSLEKELKKKVH
jgi:hypothetical protein